MVENVAASADRFPTNGKSDFIPVLDRFLCRNVPVRWGASPGDPPVPFGDGLCLRTGLLDRPGWQLLDFFSCATAQ